MKKIVPANPAAGQKQPEGTKYPMPAKLAAKGSKAKPGRRSA